MSAASDYLENKVLDHVLTTTSFNPPTERYLALFTNTGGQTAANLETGNTGDEINTGGTGYDRKTVTFAQANQGTSATNATVTFDAAQANWGTVTHVAVMDNQSGGEVLFYGAVTTPKTIETGDTFQVSSGNLTISLA